MITEPIEQPRSYHLRGTVVPAIPSLLRVRKAAQMLALRAAVAAAPPSVLQRDDAGRVLPMAAPHMGWLDPLDDNDLAILAQACNLTPLRGRHDGSARHRPGPD